MAEFYNLKVDEALAKLNVDAKTGFTSTQASQAEAQYGKNKLPVEAGESFFKILIGQFRDILVLVLIAAAVISLLLGDAEDAIVIGVIIILNAALGTYQEYRAEQALAALSAMQVPLVRVRRNGKVEQISSEDIYPGDIVLLQEGDRAPADGRVILSVNLQVEEAALTGESQGVFKEVAPLEGDTIPIGDRENMIFMGTSVAYGRGEIVVTGTGLQTELGKIASLLMGVEESKTPLQNRLNQLSLILVRGAIGVVIVVFIAGLLRGIPVREMLLTSISLAVAAVPEGLPAIITIALSMGASRMIQRNVLIRKLPAVETLGSVTIICSDKTGTLTKNEMTAISLALPGHGNVTVTGIGYNTDGQFLDEDSKAKIDPQSDMELRRFLKSMALATDALIEKDEAGNSHVLGDTTEGALLVAAQKVGWTREFLEKDMPRVSELPFSSERKAMTTIHDIASDENRELFTGVDFVAITKGAPDRLIGWATQEHLPGGPVALTDERRAVWNGQIDAMAAQGLRVLGVAYRPIASVPSPVTEEIERDLILIGLTGILDPSRPEAKDAVRVARGAGIRPMMITGDHALTAETIARDLGILEEGQKAVTGAEIEAMSEAQLLDAVKATSAFARVSPEHKLRLVKVLQSQGQVTAMTGDGVNDAPALKQADIGVAMGITGTEVSKGAADMVLTDDNFASIVAAVEEGRVIYDNIRKFVLFLLSSNVGEILVMFVGILIGLPIPLLAIQILWVNLVTDGLPAIALGFERGEVNVMKRPPRSRDESILAGGMGFRIVWRASFLAVLTLAAFIIGHTTYGMNPFSPTRDIENLDRAQVITVADNEHVPDNWDDLAVEERRTLLLEQGESGEEGSEETILAEAERIPRTIAFTVLALGQIFHVLAIRPGDRISFFSVWFRGNRIMLLAVISTFILQLIVVYVPFFQGIFETLPLNGSELAASIGLSSLMLFAVEIEKAITRSRPAPTQPQPLAAKA